MAEQPPPQTARRASPGKQARNLIRACFIGALLACGAGFFLYEFNIGRRFKNSSYDLLHIAKGDTAVSEAVVVFMDEASHEKLGQPFNAAWDRLLHAKLLDRLTTAGARAVVFDVVFSDPDLRGKTVDDALAAAMKRNGRVVLAADNVPAGDGVMKMVPPCDALLESAAAIGSAERNPDADLVVRRHTPRGDRPISTLAWVTAELLQSPATQPPGAEKVPRWIHYYGRSGVIRGISYHEALDSAQVADGVFSNKVVFIGAFRR
jgi:CHASE2 domain-containing sensor protein